jgi:hypothetical protein
MMRTRIRASLEAAAFGAPATTKLYRATSRPVSAERTAVGAAATAMLKKAISRFIDSSFLIVQSARRRPRACVARHCRVRVSG